MPHVNGQVNESHFHFHERRQRTRSILFQILCYDVRDNMHNASPCVESPAICVTLPVIDHAAIHWAENSCSCEWKHLDWVDVKDLDHYFRDDNNDRDPQHELAALMRQGLCEDSNDEEHA
jgi:hypothetical protein